MQLELRAIAKPSPVAAAGDPRIILRRWYPIVFVFLPFAAGYYLSYLFRTINALISGRLVKDIGFDASQLGLMTSVYFLAFALVQLPVGVLLDRYGPRRVQFGLLLVAAAGAAQFALADQLATLAVGRALIGIGVAGSLIAGLKAIVIWFPKDRVPLANGCFVMLGALGAVTATAPAEWLLSWIGWRGLFEILAVATAGVAAAIFAFVPEQAPNLSSVGNRHSISLKVIYGDPRFWRLAPLSTTCIGTAWALQGLWAAPWLADVEGLNRPEIVSHLFAMALALSAGALLLGVGADRLRTHGVRPETILCFVAILFVAAEFILILGLWSSSYGPWIVIAGVGAATVLSYSILAEYFPKEIAGQANAALNMFHIGGAFVIQGAIGLVINHWISHHGHYPTIAYKTAFALVVVFQIVGIAWFLPVLRVARSGNATEGVGVDAASQQLRSPEAHETASDDERQDADTPPGLVLAADDV